MRKHVGQVVVTDAAQQSEVRWLLRDQSFQQSGIKISSHTKIQPQPIQGWGKLQQKFHIFVLLALAKAEDKRPLPQIDRRQRRIPARYMIASIIGNSDLLERRHAKAGDVIA